ncbi:hypothetical protein B0H15DRAFT_953200 [Mycena belliarum]|uniref:Uncharacterized protein n=1 Tax=Mycena belliarum TaxID=1033014 RepID=A0AAD6XII8_9AGAR|nr:hypothetical protein B0H15DRAFT_953200 [Mycena belliae]
MSVDPHSHPLPLDVAPREQCLKNSDLVEEIISHIASTENLDTRRESLRLLALTCKVFSPVALKLLWRQLDNLIPLLHLLEGFKNERGSAYFLFQSQEPSGWETFDFHAARVREITYKPQNRIEIDPSVYVRLAQHGAPILPNLWRLDCTTTYPSASETLLYMESPLQAVKFGAEVKAVRDILVWALMAKPARITTLALPLVMSRIFSTTIDFNSGAYRSTNTEPWSCFSSW